MISKGKFFSLLLFFLVPLLSVIYSFLKLRKENNNNFYYFFISLFFGFLFLKNPPLMDSIRYLEIYDLVQKEDLAYFSNYVNYYYVAYFFKSIGLNYYFIPTFFVTISVFCIFKSMDLLWKKYNWSLANYIFLSIGVVILSNPVVISMGLRNSTAYFIFLLGVFYYFCGYKFKSKLTFIMTFICHFSMALPILIFVLSNFFKINKYFSLVFIVIGIIFSQLFLERILAIIPIAALREHYSNYGVDSNSDMMNGNGFIVFILFFIIKISLILICYTINSKDIISEKILNLIFYMVVLVSFVSVDQTALHRFLDITSFLCFIYICINLFNQPKRIIIKCIVSLLLVIQFFIFDFYTVRYNYIHGKMLEMTYRPIFFVLLYTDDEYREYLYRIDRDGYWKN